MNKNPDGSITLKDSAGNDVTITLDEQIQAYREVLAEEIEHQDEPDVIAATRRRLEKLYEEQERLSK